MPTKPATGGGGAALRLAAGRARAAETMPYLATALFAVAPVERPGIGTFAVDRSWRMYWDPELCLSLTVAECAGVWLHETGHLLRRHAARWSALLEPDEHHPLWNRATDAAVNADLREGGVTLPAGTAWYPERIRGAAAGMTAEQMYRLLLDDPDRDDPDRDDPERGGPECGSGAGGRPRSWEEADGGSGAVEEGRAALIRRQVASAVQEHARTRGSVPGGWQRWADAVLRPQVDWRRELASVVRRAAAHVAGLRDYSYARPSRRSSSLPGVVLPTLRQPRPPVVRVVVDTSGSMTPRMLGQSLAEIAAVVARVSRGGGNPVEVLACDTAAADVQAVRSVAGLTLTGGGGTDMRVGLRAAAARRPRADLVITLTDGETPWPAAPPEEDPAARYVAVLVRRDAPVERVPGWMHPIVVDPGHEAPPA